MKKIIQVCLTAIVLLGTNTIAKAQYIILPTFFGVNGWMGEKIGEATNNYNCYGLTLNPQQTCNPGGKFDSIILPTCSTKVKSLYVNLVRYGGALNDVNAPTYEQYINEIDKLRSMGSDIILQIPTGAGHYTAAQAYDLLYYLNVTRVKNIKYVEIGNEPDRYASYPTGGNQAKADSIAVHFRPFADTLKVADASIKIIGPSFSQYVDGVYQFLLDSTNAAQLVQKNHNNKYQLDIVDIHAYGFGGTQTLNDVQKQPNFSSYSGNFASKLTGSGIGLLDRISTANTSRSPSSKLQFSVSEMNINYANPTPIANNKWSDYGSNGFIAGQWVAETYSVILDKARLKNVDAAFVTPWSFHESKGDSSVSDNGLLVSNSPCNAKTERSVYEHMAMMGKYFKGKFYRSDSVGKYIKAFGTYQPKGYSAFMIVNESTSDYASYTISNKTGATGSTVNIDMGTNAATTYSWTNPSGILKNTTHIVFFDTCSGYIGRIEYADTTAKVHRAWRSYGTLPISLTMSSVPTGCNVSTQNIGTATVVASGGSGTYTYSWAGGQTTSSITGLAANTYIVYVKNSLGCGSTSYGISESVIVTKGSPLSAAISPTRSCAAGSVTFTASGGTSYSWSNSATTTSVSITQPANNRATEYTVYVTDANGCVNTARATHYGLVTVSIESGTTTCGNCCLVSLTATNVQGATYSWFLNGSFSAYTTTNTFSQSTGPGTYTVDILPNDGVCASSSSGNWVVTNNGNPCNCAGPGHRLASESSNSESNNLISEINSIVPNPANEKAIINYYLNSEDAKGEIRVINIYGQVIETIPISNENSSIEIDCSKYSSGIYFNTLIVNGRAVSSKKLVIAK